MHTKKKNYREFLKYVVPCVISMVAMAIFTMVDSVFVSRGVGSQALAGINVVYPVVLLLTAFAAMIALGVSTMIASRLAVGEKQGANKALMSSIWLSLIFFIALMIPSILAAEGISGILGADGAIQTYAAEYLRYYMYFSIPCGMVTIISAAVRNDGSPTLASVSLIVSCIFNIFADWLFVFPLQMGVAGAAIATGLSQILGLVILLYHFVRKKGELRLSFREKINGTECWDMVKRGFPECINQLTTPIITVCYNLVLANILGSAGLEAYAIISQPVGVIIMLLLGVADGAQPLFSHYNSIGDEETNRYYFRKSVELSVILSVAIYAIFFFFGRTIFSIFSKDGMLLDMAMRGSNLYCLRFAFSAVTMVIAGYFMSIVETRKSVVINVARTFVFNVIFVFLTPYVLGKDMVWTGIVFAELVVMLIAIVLYRNYRKAFIGKAVSA